MKPFGKKAKTVGLPPPTMGLSIVAANNQLYVESICGQMDFETAIKLLERARQFCLTKQHEQMTHGIPTAAPHGDHRH